MAIVGCELKRCGGAGLAIEGGGRAVLNDSYVYWNRGPGVRVDAYGVVSLEHNDCSLNGGGPMVVHGSVRVSFCLYSDCWGFVRAGAGCKRLVQLSII